MGETPCCRRNVARPSQPGGRVADAEGLERVVDAAASPSPRHEAALRELVERVARAVPCSRSCCSKNVAASALTA